MHSFVGCPIVIISPELISTDIGTSARFQAIVETYNDIALESRWLRQGSNKTETIDITNPRYLGSRNLPFPELVINDVTFDDQLSYELQVRIIGGWCFGNTVQLEVRGGTNIDKLSSANLVGVDEKDMPFNKSFDFI